MIKRVLVLIPVAALCAWALAAWVAAPIRCNRALNDMRGRTRATGETVNSYRLALLVRDNLTALRRLEGPCRANAYLYTLEAENEYLLGRREASIAALRRALAVDPRPELYADIGDMLFELGRVDEAADNYAIAVRFSRSYLERVPAQQLEQAIQERLRRRPAS